MTKTLRLLLALVGLLLFAVGLLLGQQIAHSKFEKYLRPAGVTPMDLAVLRANVDAVRSFVSFEVPTIYYNWSCTCFVAHATITSELMKEPLDQLRTRLMATAQTARSALEVEFPELYKSGTVPDRDFKMTFFEMNLKTPEASRDIAEYTDGKIVFR